MKYIKQIVIRWAVKQLKKEAEGGKSYAQLEKYGVADIMKNNQTGEEMYIFD